MKRDEKEALVEELGKEIEAADAIFAIDYRGISVTQSAELRGKLRDADTSFRVVKNRLTKLAAAKAGVAELDPMLEGPTALAFVRGDTAMAAKAITTFNREYEVLTYKGGLMDGAELDETKFKAIAKLPSRDALNAQLAGVVASPLVTLTRGLGSLISGLAIQLQQVAYQGLVGGTAEPPTEEPAGGEADSEPEEPATDTDDDAAGETPEQEEPAGEPESADDADEGESEGDQPEQESDEDDAEAEEPAGEAGDKAEAPADEADEAGDGDEAGEDGDEE